MRPIKHEQTIELAALTQGRNVPSARFRVRQYRQALLDNGIVVREYCPVVRQMIRLPGLLGRIRRRYLLPWLLIQALINLATRFPVFIASRKADVTFINRSVIPGFEESVKLLARPRVLDVDDAIWLTDPRGVSSAIRLAKNVDAVVAGNKYLADWYRQYNDRVFVVPTAIDTDKYTPISCQSSTEKRRCTIGWIGTSGNFSSLGLVKAALMQVLRKREGVKVLIVSNQRPQGWEFDGEQIEFRYWSEENEVKDLQSMDIGIMPLHDDSWAKGKCSFKMLQYMAIGLPVVVSPVGMNEDVLDQGHIGFAACDTSQWVNSLLKLIDDQSLRNILGSNGRKLVTNVYSVKVVSENIAVIFRNGFL